jgi:hypothetical protein
MRKLMCFRPLLWKGLVGILLVALAPFGVKANQVNNSSLCKFQLGPKAGTTYRYNPATSFAVGSRCGDGAGSSGFIVDPRFAEGFSNGPASKAGESTLCSFNDGPQAGTIRDRAPKPPLPVGSACEDADGSKGTIVAKREASTTHPTKHPYVTGSELSRLCRFNSGPKIGKVDDSTPRVAVPVGSRCTDGAESFGIVVPAKSLFPQKPTTPP